MTTITTLTGLDAITYAARTGATLHKHTDPVDGAREVTADEAREIAREDAGLIWCDAYLDPHTREIDGLENASDATLAGLDALRDECTRTRTVTMRDLSDEARLASVAARAAYDAAFDAALAAG